MMPADLFVWFYGLLHLHHYFVVYLYFDKIELPFNIKQYVN